MDDKDKTSAPGSGTGRPPAATPEERRAREAEALRANLMRRKAQQRARRAAESAAADEEPEASR